MNHYLCLTDYEKNLIDNALLLLMKKNIQYSEQSKENSVQQHYQDFNLTLFELCAKIKAPDFDKHMDLSSKEIKAIKKGLTSLYNRIYRKALKKTESHQESHYKSCKLQIIELDRKIDIIEKSNIESDLC